MTDRDEKYRQKYLAALEPHTEGEVRAVGVFSHSGSMGAALLGQVSPLAGTLKRRVGKKKAGGMPTNMIVAATDDKVYVFEFKPKGFSIKVKDAVVVWDRAAVQAAPASEGALADRLIVQVGDGDPIELDTNKMPGIKSEFNEPLIRLLGAG